jgi:hypothetical protein
MATFSRIGLPEPWLITTALMNPLPMSRPTVERAREKSAIAVRIVRWIVAERYSRERREVK